jgi:hypothetical protein
MILMNISGEGNATEIVLLLDDEAHSVIFEGEKNLYRL